MFCFGAPLGAPISRARLWPLDDDMHFVPGQGPMSSFEQERKTNPYVSDTALARS